MHPVITIFCPFTRRWAVDQWLKNLAGLNIDPNRTNLCILVDTDEPYIWRTVQRFAEVRNYRSFHVKINEFHATNESKLSYRRMRVAEIHNQAKDLIAICDGDFVIGLEDDTVFDRDPDLIQKLLQPFSDFSNTGFVQGVQVGRHGARIVGVWEFDNPDDPKVVKTLLPSEGLQEITAGGFYGYATTKELFLKHEYYTSTGQPWGPDVNFGVWLQQRGYKCFVDWGVNFGHRDYNQTMYPDDPDARLCQIVYTKSDINGKWNRTDHEQDRY